MKTQGHARHGRLGFRQQCLFGAALCLAALLVPLTVGADEQSPALDAYRKDVDAAIERALAFLAKQQKKDGSFVSGAMDQNTGISSLCVMAFLAKGYTPASGPYQDVINRGIDFILDQQKPNGLLVGETKSHGPMYSHSISALMLAEVSGMVDPDRQQRIDEALSKALKITLAAQKVQRQNPRQQGGWRYQHTSQDSDMSLTGWALMSLRSARANGADIPKQAVDDAIKFVMNCRTGDGGFAYQPGSAPGLARTGTALLCLELCGRHQDAAALAAGDWVLRHLPTRFEERGRGEGDGFFYYGLYYCSQGMFQLGGKYWETWATAMYDMMLKCQEKDGRWPEGGGNEGRAGPCYSTAMGVLAMSVACRQLPIYQR